MDQQQSTTLSPLPPTPNTNNSITAAAAAITTATTDEEIERQMQALAEGVGAMRLEPGINGIIVQDLLNQPQNLTAVVRSDDELRNLLYARFGKDEAEHLMHNDADFVSTLPLGVDEDGRVHAFARFVDTRAALSYRVPCTTLIGALSNSGATLRVHSVLGISETGWAALLAVTDSGLLRLYYMHERTSLRKNADGAEQHYCWTRHPRLPDLCVDNLGVSALHRDIIALWLATSQQLLIASLDPKRATSAAGAVWRSINFSRFGRLVVSALVATERYVVLLLDDTSVVFVWLAAMPPENGGGGDESAEAHIAGYHMQKEFPVVPSERLAERPCPTNPLSGERLEPLAGLGGGDANTDKWQQKHHANSLAIDQHDDNVVVIGTDGGYALMVVVGAEPRQLSAIDFPLPMGDPPEHDLLRAAAVRKNHPGLEPVETICSRSPHKDGSVCTTMAHSMTVRCPHATYVSQISGVTPRLPMLQEVNLPELACVQLNGVDLLVHHRATNTVMIGNITPSPSGRVVRYRVAPPTITDPKSNEEVEQRFPLAKSAYRSLYVALEHATVLMPDGRCLRVRPSGEEENAAYIRLMMQKSAEARGDTATLAALAQHQTTNNSSTATSATSGANP